MQKITHLVAIMLSALVLTACGEDKTTANTENNNIKARQDLMQDWRFANDTLKGMAENPANFDAELAKTQAKILADSSEKMWQYFNDPAAAGKSKPEVWSDPTAFQAAIDKFNTAVATLNTATQNATQISDLESAMGQVGESCGSCHKAFKN